MNIHRTGDSLVLPQVIWRVEPFEEDRVAGVVANFLASELVSNYTNCLLSSQGQTNFSADTVTMS